MSAKKAAVKKENLKKTEQSKRRPAKTVSNLLNDSRKAALSKAVGKKRKAIKKRSTDIVVKVTDYHVKETLEGVQKGAKSKVVIKKLDYKKIYPPIYSYIYEREPQDMAKIYEEHKKVHESTKPVRKISGFKVVGNSLVAIGQKSKIKKK